MTAVDTATDADRAAWLEWRRHGLGASDVAALVGLSPWQSPWSLWAEKTGLTSGQIDDNESMEFGRWAELMIGPWFEARTGLHVACHQERCVHPTLDWARATLDGRVYDSPAGTLPLGGLEIKTDRMSKRWDDIPGHYQCQGQWQMFVDELDHVWFPVLHGRRLEVYELHRDDADIRLLVDTAERFWVDHVLTGTPPDVDGSDATLRALQEVWPDHTPGTTVDLDAGGVAAVHDLAAARAARRDAERAENDAKARLAAVLEAAEEGVTPGPEGRPIRLVSYRTQDRCGVDVKALTADHPDIAKTYERVTTNRVMRTHIPKEKTA